MSTDITKVLSNSLSSIWEHEDHDPKHDIVHIRDDNNNGRCHKKMALQASEVGGTTIFRISKVASLVMTHGDVIKILYPSGLDISISEVSEGIPTIVVLLSQACVGPSCFIQSLPHYR
jgi:hypothetical protein